MLPEATTASGGGIAIPELDGRIDGLKRNLDGLLQKYTEQHPDVAGARRIIKELEEQRRQEVAAMKKAASAKGAPAMAINNNPVFQQLKVSLNEAEANIASLKVRVGEYDARYNRARESMKNMPQIEAELSQLNRDYEVHKTNYASLVARRESATLTGELGSTSGIADFRLIDPPRVSPKPVAPNRMLLLLAALGGSLGAGLFASFAATQVRPVFHDARALREFTGLPLLGEVSLNRSDIQRRQHRRSLLRFFVAISVLIGVFALGLAYLAVKT